MTTAQWEKGMKQPNEDVEGCPGLGAASSFPFGISTSSFIMWREEHVVERGLEASLSSSENSG